MDKKKKEEPKIINTIDAKIPEMDDGQAMKIVNIGGNYILSPFTNDELSSFKGNYIEQSNRDMRRFEQSYSKLLDKEQNSFITTPEQITDLAKNPQFKIEKIQKINGIVKFYVNKEDLIGRVVETIENNINTNYTVK